MMYVVIGTEGNDDLGMNIPGLHPVIRHIVDGPKDCSEYVGCGQDLTV